MLRHRVVWSLVVVAVLQSLVIAQDKYAQFPRAGVELPQPSGFTVSKQFQGLEHAATGSAVIVMTLPAPYAETSVGFTAERMQAEGMTLHEKTAATIAGKKGVLLKITQVEDGVELGKWLAAIGYSSTTMIVSSFPKEAEAELSEVIKSIVTRARAIEVKRPPLGTNVDFELGDSTMLRLASDDNDTLVYTVDGTLPQPSPEAPLLVATKVNEPFGQPSLQKFALGRI